MSEYAISVSDWNEDWEYIGRDVMYSYYEKHPKEGEKEGYELDEEGKVRYLDELADHEQPMMLYAYPLEFDELEDDKIVKICRTTNCTVVRNVSSGTLFLALTGGGMNLSQDIALAYIIAQRWVPFALALVVSTQPNLSKYGKAYRRVMRGIIDSLRMNADQATRKVMEAKAGIKQSLEMEKTKQLEASTRIKPV
jgi:hypothetical protein